MQSFFTFISLNIHVITLIVGFTVSALERASCGWSLDYAPDAELSDTALTILSTLPHISAKLVVATYLLWSRWSLRMPTSFYVWPRTVLVFKMLHGFNPPYKTKKLDNDTCFTLGQTPLVHQFWNT
jgi:hypothetical protein